MLTSVLAAIEKETATVIDFQQLLVSIPAIAPEGGGQGEDEKARAVQDYLSRFGFPTPQIIKAPDSRVACGYRPSLSYVIPGRDPSKTFWVLAHLDVVPPGDAAAWQTDPFTLKVDGDVIYGRGVEDNHHGLVSGFLLAKALVAEKAVPPINYGLLLVADEENGNAYGLDYIVKNHAGLFGPQDMFLVPDAGNAEGTLIEIAEKSILWLKVVVEGKQCHASMPQEGCNTLRAAADFIVRLEALKEKYGRTDDLFDPPTSTFEPTKKEANVDSINIIPGRDVFYIDCRVLPGYDLADVRATIEGIGAEVAAKHGVRLSYEEKQHVQAAPATPPDAAIVRQLSKAITDVYGGTPFCQGIGGGTFAALLRARGFPAVVWSAILENAHQPNERALVSTMVKDALVMARVLWDNA